MCALKRPPRGVVNCLSDYQVPICIFVSQAENIAEYMAGNIHLTAGGGGFYSAVFGLPSAPLTKFFKFGYSLR